MNKIYCDHCFEIYNKKYEMNKIVKNYYQYNSYFEKNICFYNLTIYQCKYCNHEYLNEISLNIINKKFNLMEKEWMKSFITNKNDLKKYFFKKEDTVNEIKNSNLNKFQIVRIINDLNKYSFFIENGNDIYYLKKSIYRLKKGCNGKFPIKEGFIDYDPDNDKEAKLRVYCSCGREMKLHHQYKKFFHEINDFIIINNIDIYKCPVHEYVEINENLNKKIFNKLNKYKSE